MRRFLRASVAVIFASIACTARAQYTVLHQFGSNHTDGQEPYGSPILSGSALYGTTVEGGTNGEGVIFQISTNGTGYVNLHQFGSSPSDGSQAYGSLLLSGSMLYGMTEFGGTNGGGVIFQVGTNGTGYANLHQFPSSPTDGKFPQGSLLLSGSTLCGMADSGGTNGDGVIFQINTNGTGYATPYQFGGIPNDGRGPHGSLVQSDSMLYGMTENGGTNSAGVLFQIDTNGTGYAILYEFGNGASDGKFPYGSLLQSGSTLYGMTENGGTNGGGVIFQISTNGTGYALLYEFPSNSSDGSEPYGSLVLSGPTLYGMTFRGGTNEVFYGGLAQEFPAGVLFQLRTNGTGYAIVHEFGSSHIDGGDPNGSPLLSGSTLYGLTFAGGTNGLGAIFSLGGASPPPLVLQITGIAMQTNSIQITWETTPGSTNALQATGGSADGSYNTNNFADIFAVTNVAGPATNYIDVGGATNFPSRYYRVRLVP